MLTSILEQLEQPRVSRLEVGDVTVAVSHVERILWPARDGYPALTKRDLLMYFTRLADPLLHRAGISRTCEAALWLKRVLDQLKLRAFLKTSGKTGLHIVVPILRHFDYDAVRRMAEQICRHVLRQHPDVLTMEWSV